VVEGGSAEFGGRGGRGLGSPGRIIKGDREISKLPWWPM